MLKLLSTALFLIISISTTNAVVHTIPVLDWEHYSIDANDNGRNDITIDSPFEEGIAVITSLCPINPTGSIIPSLEEGSYMSGFKNRSDLLISPLLEGYFQLNPTEPFWPGAAAFVLHEENPIFAGWLFSQITPPSQEPIAVRLTGFVVDTVDFFANNGPITVYTHDYGWFDIGADPTFVSLTDTGIPEPAAATPLALIALLAARRRQAHY